MLDPPDIRLDSSHPAGQRWSAPVWPATMRLRCDALDGPARLDDGSRILRQWADPLDALAWLADDIRADASASARWIGYLSYDLGRLFETLPVRAADDLQLPLFLFTRHEKTATSSVAPTFQTASADPEGLSAPAAPADLSAGHPDISSNFTRQQYEAAVARCIEYVAAGDIFQVNLTQRFTAPRRRRTPRQVYQRLIRQSPAWFGACLDHGDHALLCNSPELFLRVTPDRRVITRPVKGTRPRAPGMEAELRHSVKDQAELNMIVDLERNDLGRVCEIGAVKVVEPRVIEAHPTVYHGVATVEGRLRSDVGFVDLLRATFPGGSITGAPKIRAMQIIEELEPTRRGPYCGTIGYLDADGAIELNIAIRTMIVTRDRFHIPVGGGIVADSIPADEYLETLVKAQALFAALGITRHPPPSQGGVGGG